MTQEKQEEKLDIRSLADELKEKMKGKESDEGFQIKRFNKKPAIKDTY